jgi:hypothetical protein
MAKAMAATTMAMPAAAAAECYITHQIKMVLPLLLAAAWQQ